MCVCVRVFLGVNFENSFGEALILDTDLDGYTVWSFIGFHKMYIPICLITGLGEASFAKVEPAKCVCVCVCVCFWESTLKTVFGEAPILDNGT